MKKLNATFEVNSDFEEHNLRITLEGLGGKYLKTLPNSTHLKDDAHYKELRKQKKHAEDNLYKYIDSKR